MPGRCAARQPSWSHRNGARRFAALVFALMLSATKARADVVLAPASDGHLGAFLAAGPVPLEAALDVPLASPTAAGKVSARFG